MSYDLAIWEGDRPATDREALAEYLRLYDEFMDARYPTPPTPAVTRYVEELLSKWPDLDPDGESESPWSTGPLMPNASGPLFYVPMVRWTPTVIMDEIARLAAASGLVCFDPQTNAMR